MYKIFLKMKYEYNVYNIYISYKMIIYIRKKIKISKVLNKLVSKI